MSGCDARGLAFTAKELAELLGVRPKTIQKWRDRGYLTPVGHRGRASLYDWREAVEVEMERRQHPNLRVARSRVIVGT